MAQPYHRLDARPNPRLLSVVIPAYNEQEVLPILRDRLTQFIDSLPCPVEVLMVNDGSRDRTLELLLDWAAQDRRIKVLGLARNFGHQAAVSAGLDLAAGDAVVIMDADLQDPPEVVHEMLSRYRDGYDVVYGQRVQREGETRFKLFTAWAFYRIMRGFVHKDLPADTGDFRLVSRRCVDALKSMRETHRFLRGMVAWVGFAQTAVPFKRPARAAGETKYPLRKMLKFAWTAIVSFSPAPLTMSIFSGLFVALLGVIAIIYAVVVKLAFNTDLPTSGTAPGWASLMVMLCLIGSMILIAIGVVGEYIGRIFEEAKGRPIYIISTLANIDVPSPVIGPSPVGLVLAQISPVPRLHETLDRETAPATTASQS